MHAERACERIQPVLPEVALGVAEARDRAEALAHLAGCDACRDELDRLARIGDELLLLAPQRQPTPGFEGRALAAMRTQPVARPRSRVRALVPALAAALAAVLTAGGLAIVFSEDLELADRYRETLEVADGRYFSAVELYGAGGVRSGHVFGYEGSPAWVFVAVEPRTLRSRSYEVEAVTATGRRVSLGELPGHGGAGAGWTLPIEFGKVAEVRVVGPRPGEALTAELGH